MDVSLEYGRGALDLTLPSNARPTIIRKPAMDLPDDPGAAIKAALAAPLGCAPLSELARDAP